MASWAGEDGRDEDEEGRGRSGAEGEPPSLGRAVEGGDDESLGSRMMGTEGECESVRRAEVGLERVPSLRFTDDRRRATPEGREGTGSWWAGSFSSSESSSGGRLRAHAAGVERESQLGAEGST